MTEKVDLKGATVYHTRFQKALDDACDAIRLCEDRGAIIPILGPTRVGKGELIKCLDQAFGEKANGVGYFIKSRNFVTGKIEAQPNVKSLFSAVANALEAPMPKTWSASDLKHWVSNHIAERGTRYVVLDECSHCAEPGANLSPRAAADHWKEFVDETGVTLILTGLPKFQTKIIDQNEQFRDRSMNTIYLWPYNWSLEEDRQEFVEATAALFSQLLDDGVDNDPDQHDLYRRMYAVSGGRIGRVKEILNDALKIRKNQSELTFAEIQRVAQLTIQTPPGQKNPFADQRLTDQDLISAYNKVIADAKKVVSKPRRTQQKAPASAK